MQYSMVKHFTMVNCKHAPLKYVIYGLTLYIAVKQFTIGKLRYCYVKS